MNTLITKFLTPLFPKKKLRKSNVKKNVKPPSSTKQKVSQKDIEKLYDFCGEVPFDQ
jgi:hypothetical protein